MPKVVASKSDLRGPIDFCRQKYKRKKFKKAEREVNKARPLYPTVLIKSRLRLMFVITQIVEIITGTLGLPTA